MSRQALIANAASLPAPVATAARERGQALDVKTTLEELVTELRQQPTSPSADPKDPCWDVRAVR